MTPDQLAEAVRGCLQSAVDAGDLTITVPEEIRVERPRNRAHGDWSTNVALQLAGPSGRPPREVAQVLADRLGAVDGVAGVDIAGPGFINVTLAAGAAGRLAADIVAGGERFGHGTSQAGQRIDLEFVSANPTGPIHLGGVRWAAVGDSLARVLQACGAQVTREYYFNDHGAQIDRFAQSLIARARGQQVAEDGYGGEYVAQIAARVLERVPDALDAGDAQEVFRREGVDLMFAEIKQSLHDFGVDFDVFFHENEVHESGAVDRAIARLRENGHIAEVDGAIWLRTTTFGDDKDRVVVKSDGEPTYFAADLAYYLHKRERGFDRCLLMLGADHHGYVARMMAMAAAFGDEPGVNLEILIGQLVNLVRDGAPVRMSKRAGTVVTIDDLVDVVGVDAARYVLARSSADSQIDVDLDLLRKRSNDNPVFYVQYAHARCSGVIRGATEAGVVVDPGAADGGFDGALLAAPSESTLLAALADYPRVVAQAAELREPHRVARYLEELAGRFHQWYDACRVLPLGEEPVTDLHRSRLCLAMAVRQVLANGLGLLGVTAPDRM